MLLRSVVVVVVVGVTVMAVASRYADRRGHEAGFWFEDFPLALSPAATREMGGPLSDHEASAIREQARAELEAAFAGLPIRITDRHDAFWRVSVGALVTGRGAGRIVAGETWAMGRFGGYSHVSFRTVAHAALTYAPQGASRDLVVRAIGRGIGRTAAHELAHAILGPSPTMDGTGDESSYEFHSFSRPAQYYGELHWVDGRAALVDRLSGLRGRW